MDVLENKSGNVYDNYLDSFPKKPEFLPVIPYIVMAWVPLAFYIVFGLPYLITACRAQLWVKTPCVVVSVTPVRYFLGSHRSWVVYGAGLKYSYEFRGGKYTADRYSPSCDYDGLNSETEVVVRGIYPVGRNLTCYVNSWNPAEAVIDRSFTGPQLWAMILIPPLFFIVGIYTPISVMRRIKARKGVLDEAVNSSSPISPPPRKTEAEKLAALYIPQLGGPHQENAYHSLIEADDAIVPLIIDAYEHESDPERRTILFEVLCKHKASESLEFLSRAIAETDPKNWKLALDGLVTIGGPRAKEVLEGERLRLRGLNPVPRERLEWVEEAITQLG